MLKYKTSASASTTVVMSGLAITAGSNFSFAAMMGKEQPINFASITVKATVSATVKMMPKVTSGFEKSRPSTR